MSNKDTIYRQAVIDALYDWSEHSMTDAEAWHIKQVIGDIKSLPSAQPERKKGKWIHHPEWEDDGECGYECSECHMGSDVDYNFCMRCGADMRGEQDGNQGEGS